MYRKTPSFARKNMVSGEDVPKKTKPLMYGSTPQDSRISYKYHQFPQMFPGFPQNFPENPQKFSPIFPRFSGKNPPFLFPFISAGLSGRLLHRDGQVHHGMLAVLVHLRRRKGDGGFLDWILWYDLSI